MDTHPSQATPNQTCKNYQWYGVGDEEADHVGRLVGKCVTQKINYVLGDFHIQPIAAEVTQ